MSYKYIVGIDEAGRGPLAGPVSLGAVKIKKDVYSKEYLFTVFPGLNDSKKISSKKREVLFKKIKKAKEDELIDFSLSLSSNVNIDKVGIVSSLKMCIERSLGTLNINHKDKILLDGSLKVGDDFKNQNTIIRGDEKEPLIMLASIIAKVSRDNLMIGMDKKYPKYGFDKHKGYGTKAHQEAILKYGVCEIHRKTFLKNILK